MTKVSVFGQETEKKQGKPIEFVKWVYAYNEKKVQVINFSKSDDGIPSSWDNICLLHKNYHGSIYDLIFSSDNNGRHCIFLGHWNDGFVQQ